MNNATAKFYSGLLVALVLIVGLSFATGYHFGHAARGAHAGSAAGSR
jgi:hypothetical protein